MLDFDKCQQLQMKFSIPSRDGKRAGISGPARPVKIFPRPGPCVFTKISARPGPHVFQKNFGPAEPVAETNDAINYL